VCPRAVLDKVVKRIIPSPLRESNPRTPIAQYKENFNFTFFASHYRPTELPFSYDYIVTICVYCLSFFFSGKFESSFI
jgi:hypothetical protein